MSARPFAAVSVFLFLLERGIVNGARRQLGRLRQPRYLAGTIVGALYFYFYFFRFLLGGGPWRRMPAGGMAVPEAALSLLLLLASLALAIFAALSWFFRSPAPRLPLTEADVQFLMPAPLPGRSVVHFALLRSQLPLLFSAFITGLVFSRGLSASGGQRVVAYWLLLSTLHFHGLGLAFSKASLRERAGTVARVVDRGLVVVAALTAVALVLWAVDGVRLVVAAVGTGRFPGSSALAPVLSGWTAGWVPRLLLAPFRAVLAPVFAPDPVRFRDALPPALAILVAHYFWVARVTRRYEEAALEGARRRSERAAWLRKGRIGSLPAESRRRIVPFRLAPLGRPELAVLWKNLLGQRRSELRTTVKGIALLWAVLVVVAAAVASGTAGVAVMPMAMGFASLSVPLALMLPFALRNDFRTDLEHASILRGWPLVPSQLVVAELLAPFVVAVLWLWGLLGVVAALLAGLRISVVGGYAAPLVGQAFATTAFGVSVWDLAIPGLLGLALFLPSLVAVVLVVQNAAVLALPAWFPPGARRARGFEATGTRLIGFFGTLLILAFALLPAVLVGGAVGLVGWPWLEAWACVPAGLVAALPLWAEAAAAVPLLGRLFASFDVAVEPVE
jgi:ABC-2 type transport system permease protein